MYIRRSRRRFLRPRYMFLVLAIIVFTPKLALSDAPHLTAFFDAIGVNQTQTS